MKIEDLPKITKHLELRNEFLKKQDSGKFITKDDIINLKINIETTNSYDFIKEI